MQLQIAAGMRCGGQGEGRPLAVVALQQQILPGMVARRPAGRRAQHHPADIATNIAQLQYLAAEGAHRQFTGGEHAVPVQHAILQRLGQAGEQLAVIQLGAGLAYPALYQQRRADVAVAVTAALRAVVAEAAGAVENALAELEFEHRARGLQGDFHQSIPRLAHSSSTRLTTASSRSITRPHSRLVSPGHLWVASRPILLPRPDTGEAKSR